MITATESFTMPQLQDRLKKMAQRAQSLCGVTVSGEPLSKAVPAFLEQMSKDYLDPDWNKARAEFLIKAENDPKVRQQLSAVRVETYNNFILADQNVIPHFFEIVNLKDDERPAAQNTTDQEIRVTYVGQDGQPEEVKIVRKDEEVLIDLHKLVTKEIRYRKMDIYRGSIIDAALQTIRVGYDMDNQMEARGFSLVTATVANGGCFGGFTFGDPKKVNWVYVANSRINKKNLPDTNDILVPGTGSKSKFGFRVFKAAKKYADQWGKAFPEGPLYPTGRILVPAIDASDIADEIVPTGQTRNQIADDLMEKGWTAPIGYLGVNWVLVQDNTLEPGQCYPEYNRKPGRVYLKPGMDQERVRTDEYENDLKNEESRWMSKIFGAYVNSATRVNTARLTYSQP